MRYEKILEETVAENFPNKKKKIVNEVQEDKSKEKHAKTHTNQTNRAETQRKNIKST